MKLTFIPEAEIKRLMGADHPLPRTADACRLNTLSMIREAGSGHIGTSFSAMDILVWLHLEVMDLEGEHPDIYFSSKGHDAPGLYAVLIALGQLPYDQIHRLRKLDGLPGHPDIHTPGMVTNTGSLGMGISKAKGMIVSDRLNGIRRHYYVLTGDGELQEGQNWEALLGASHRAMGELTVIVDHNKIQSDTWVNRVSDLGDLPARFASHGWAVRRVDGHDFDALRQARNELEAGHPDQPKVIIADTVKGQGVSFMTAIDPVEGFDWYRFHSGAPSPEHYERAVGEILERLGPVQTEESEHTLPTPPSGQRLVRAYGEALVEEAERDPSIVALDADLMLDCGLVEFQKRFPDRFIECGIAEMDMVSQAGGLALRGHLPVVHSFGCFLTPRANEQIYNNATEETKIIYAGSLVGLLPGGPGHSHQSVRDFGILSQIPGLTCIEPCCENEIVSALNWAIHQNPLSTYLRLVTIPVDIPFDSPSSFPEHGEGTVLRDGSDVAVIGYGPVLLSEAWHAIEDTGLNARLINLPWLNHLDPKWLKNALGGCKSVFTLDNHYRHGGQGDMIARTLAELGIGIPVKRLGPDSVPACGTNEEVLRAHLLHRSQLGEIFSAS
jgi:transketolase